MGSTGAVGSLRVLHVINQLNGGGAEQSLVANVLATSSDIEQAIVTLKPAGAHDDLRDAGVALFEPEAHRRHGRIGSIRLVRRSIRAFDPDIVHTSLFEADLAGRVAGWAERRRTLTSLVTTPYGRQARDAEGVPSWKLATVRMVDRALHLVATSGVHAISAATAEHAIEHLRIAPGRIRVIARGRASAALGEPTPGRRDRVREEQGWGAGAVVINVARQEPPKGQDTLLEAFAMVQREYPDALLVIVGREGRSTPQLRAATSSLGLDGSVLFLGARGDVADLLAAADCFAFPSRYEGLGGAVIEACALAVPTITSDLPAIREVLGEDYPWLVPTGDVDALTASIRAVLSDPAAAIEVAERQRARFADLFEIGVIGSQMVRLYRDLAARTPPKGGLLQRVPTLGSWS